MKTRVIKQIVKGVKAVDGAGVNLTRVLGKPNIYDFDPFLMLDSFDSFNPEDYVKGFPWHPHRGIETVTYLVNGAIRHADTIGNHGVISEGSSQWMSAGGGILHQEMPLASEHMLGFQLWINMPKEHKMHKPMYNELNIGKEIQEVKEQNATINVISGQYKGVSGFAPKFVQATILDVLLEPNSTFEYLLDEKQSAFVFLMQNEANIDGVNVEEKSAVLLENGNKIEIRSKELPLRFALFHALPLNEPIAWAGPIVMNSKDELKTAFDELDAGSFIKNN